MVTDQEPINVQMATNWLATHLDRFVRNYRKIFSIILTLFISLFILSAILIPTLLFAKLDNIYIILMRYYKESIYYYNGGESGIRTHERVSPKHAFQACALNHSAISPLKIYKCPRMFSVASIFCEPKR